MMPNAASPTPSQWSSFVREHLRLSGVRPEREAEIVEDLARQLDDAYREALAWGPQKPRACAVAERHISDWARLAERDLRVGGTEDRADDAMAGTRGRARLA